MHKNIAFECQNFVLRGLHVRGRRMHILEEGMVVAAQNLGLGVLSGFEILSVASTGHNGGMKETPKVIG